MPGEAEFVVTGPASAVSASRCASLRRSSEMVSFYPRPRPRHLQQVHGTCQCIAELVWAIIWKLERFTNCVMKHKNMSNCD